MSQIQYTFSILQYRHDAWTGEALNVGVLLCAPDAGFMKMKIRTAGSRLEQAYPDLDTKKFNQLLRAIEAKVTLLSKELKQRSMSKDELNAKNVSGRLLAPDDSAMHWREPSVGITSSPSEELDRKFSRYVTRWDHNSSHDARFEDDLFELRRRNFSAEYKSILRLVYYQQPIPKFLMGERSPSAPRRLEVLELAGLVSNTSRGPRLTDSGVHALKQAYGAKRPPFIDFKHDARLTQKEQKRQFIVGSSLASALAREVRGGV